MPSSRSRDPITSILPPAGYSHRQILPVKTKWDKVYVNVKSLFFLLNTLQPAVQDRNRMAGISAHLLRPVFRRDTDLCVLYADYGICDAETAGRILNN